MSVNQGAVDFAVKLGKIMADVGYVKKDATNEHFKYRYASADAVLTKVRDACCKFGVAIESRARLDRLEIIGTKSLAVVHLSITLTDGIGQAVIEGIGSGIDSGDKSVMKANTAALKYAMSSGFLISWGDDPEADRKTDADAANASNERGKESLRHNPSDALIDPIELPREYPDFNALVGDHAGKKGINALRNVGVQAKAKGWTQDELFKWIGAQGVVLSDMGLQNSDFVKLNHLIKEA